MILLNEENPTTIWEKEQTSSKEDCKIELIAENKEDELYIESGCSTHRTGDQKKFISLKKGKSGSVAFGNYSTVKILGKGVADLQNEKLNSKCVLLIEDLKHNIPSVGKMCDQGYNLIFNSRKFEIKEAYLGVLVATTTRNPDNIYILDRVKRKKTKALQKRTK